MKKGAIRRYRRGMSRVRESHGFQSQGKEEKIDKAVEILRDEIDRMDTEELKQVIPSKGSDSRSLGGRSS